MTIHCDEKIITLRDHVEAILKKFNRRTSFFCNDFSRSLHYFSLWINFACILFDT